jgi:acetyl-CoA carboxylase biotin carboxylase subunit
MFEKVLIANRGEIAVRVARACRELGVRTVAVYSTADRDSAVLRLADESVCIGPPPSRHSYLNAAAVVEAALQTGADAVHPGYGFLSEDADFAEICTDNGLTFIGPPPEVLSQLGDKATARVLMQRAGLPLLPGSAQVISDATDAVATADRIGFPVILKAAAGGGGRGMTVVWDPADVVRAYRDTRRVAQNVFGDDRVYVERYLERARHVEVQFLCDAHGQGIHLGTRDCSVQRRRQKLVEEAPAPALALDTALAMCEAAAQAATGAGFTGAGTAEFLVDEDERYYFMEVNSRIQVEHPVTEMVTGVDLVHEQLRIAAGMPLRWQQADVALRGVSMECRVNAEDPQRQFAPTPAVVGRFLPPGGPFTRVDTHGFPGWRVGPDYDSLLAKVVVWGHDRDEAMHRMDRALGEFDVDGPGLATTIPFLRRVLADSEFRGATHFTGLVDRLAADSVTGTGVPAAQTGVPEERPGRAAALSEEGNHEYETVR